MPDMMQTSELLRQRQAELSKGVGGSAGMTTLADRERRHRLRAIVWALTGRRSRRRDSGDGRNL